MQSPSKSTRVLRAPPPPRQYGVDRRRGRGRAHRLRRALRRDRGALVFHGLALGLARTFRPAASPARLPARGGAVMTALRADVPRVATFGTILDVRPETAAHDSVGAATTMAKLTGARLVACRVPERRADRAILATAREEAAELIVVDARLQRSADIARLVRPSLEAGFRVLAIPPTARTGLRIEHIGVGHDGGPAAQAALASATELIAIAGDAVARLDVVYVDNASAPSDEPDAQELTASRDAMIEWWLEALSHEVRAMVRPLRLAGEPARALASLSLDVDLLVVGTRRRGRLRRLLDASVATELLAHARCPLLIVPEP